MYVPQKQENGRWAVQNDCTGRYTAGTYPTKAAAQKIADSANGKPVKRVSVNDVFASPRSWM